jgi:hypothetical protein
MPFAPGVQMQQVPGMSLGKAIGVHTTNAASNEDVDFELDAKIRGQSESQAYELVLTSGQTS